MKRVRNAFFFLSILVVANCSSSKTTISGIIQDQQGPIEGAVVRAQTSDVFTITKPDGTFTLEGLAAGESVVITAWAQGYFIAASETSFLPGSTDVLIELIPHADQDNPDYQWISAYSIDRNINNCQNCHARQDDQEPELPFDQWAVDAHSNAALNEIFLTMYLGTDIEGNQSPLTTKGFSRDYGSFPLPPDQYEPYYGPGYVLDFPDSAGNCAACHVPAAAVNNPYSSDPIEAEGVALEGITCDFCHKVWSVKLDDSGLPFPNMPGVISFEFRRPFEDHQFFAGPFDDVAPGEDTYSPIQHQSQFCAACHYAVFWDTTVYNSYGEWLESPYSDPETGQTCQDCHMLAYGSDHFALIDQGGLIRDPKTLHSHYMPGASDQETLENAVTMTVDAEWKAGEIVVSIEIINDQTGHHVPTDSPLRHLILWISVTDQEGKPLNQLGGSTLPDWVGVGDPAEGYFAGLPGKAFAKILEETWTGISPSGAYWNPTRVVSDNRIPAFGSDRSEYAFSAPEDGQITIEVKLIYRRAFIELSDQKQWDIPDILMEQNSEILGKSDD